MLNSFLVIRYHVSKEHQLKLEDYKQRYMSAAKRADGELSCLCKCSLCGTIIVAASMRGHFQYRHKNVPSAKGHFTAFLVHNLKVKRIHCFLKPVEGLSMDFAQFF